MQMVIEENFQIKGMFDNQNIKLDDLALMCSTINYEILSNISYRVPRMFIEN